jgi:hypothetical protein
MSTQLPSLSERKFPEVTPMSGDDDPLLLARLELDALRRLVELEQLKRVRLAARIAGRTGERVYWVESDDEVADEATREALVAFAPTAWWDDAEPDPPPVED